MESSGAAAVRAAEPDVAQQKSDRRQASVLFADISGFTALSQKMDPEDMAATMDACFRVLEKVIVERGGVVDKFIGDCVMALFGAPKAIEHAPRQAVNAAIAIRGALRRFNVERRLPSPLDCHIGVNTGLVVAGDMGGDVRRDYTVMGPTVNIAARLEGQAKNGQIFVGPSTYRYISDEFRFKKLEPLSLKGIEKPVQAWEVDGEQEYVHDARAADRALALHSETVGRDKEIATLQAALTALAAGRGGVVSIEGENGIGKSRLLAESLRGEARDSVTALEGRSVSIGQTLSFHPFVDLLEAWAGVADDASEAAALATLEASTRTLMGEEADEVFPFVARLTGRRPGPRYEERLAGIQGEALETLIHRGVRLLFCTLAEQKPLALIFDDLHWADQSSISLLASLLPLAETHPILFLFAFRPEHDDTSGVILSAVRARSACPQTEVRPQPLEEQDCRILLRNLLGSAEFPEQVGELIHGKASGNPLYMEEVLRSLLDAGALEKRGNRLVATGVLAGVEIHGTIEEVVMGRIDRLDPIARSVLETASVVGRRFHKRVLAEVVSPDIDLDLEIDHLVDKRFLCRVASRGTADPARRALSVEDGYFFENTFTQEKLYDTILKRTRRELHARSAEAIERIFGDHLDDFHGLLAWHFTQAENYDKAREHLQKAGDAAASSAASAEALGFFREAYRVFLLAHGEKGHTEERAMFERNIAMALLNTGKLAESVDHFNAALELLGEPVPKTSFQIRSKFARDLPAVLLGLYTGRLGRRGSGNEKDRHLFELMYNRCRVQNIVDAERGFFDNIAAIRHLSHLDPETVPNATGIFASAGTFFAFAGLSFDVSRRFLAIAERLAQGGTATDRFQYETMNFVLHWHEGDWSEQRDVDEALFEQGLRQGLLWNADVYLGLCCERHIRQGRFDVAAVEIAKLAELNEEWGYEFARSNEFLMRALLLLEQRKVAEARQAMQRYHDFRSEDTLHVLALSARAKIETILGDHGPAEASLASAEQILARAGMMPPYYLGALRTGRLRLAVTVLEKEKAAGAVSSASAKRARAAARKALAAASKIARERTECFRLSARVEFALGKSAAADRLWEQALKEGEKLGALPELARAWSDISRALAVRGPAATFRGETGEVWRARAEETFRQLGCEWDLDRLARTVLT